MKTFEVVGKLIMSQRSTWRVQQNINAVLRERLNDEKWMGALQAWCFFPEEGGARASYYVFPRHSFFPLVLSLSQLLFCAGMD